MKQVLHKHHVIPRHAGGTDSPENIVTLTPEEHAEAHRILYEKYGRWQDKLAWKGLSGQIDNDEIMREIWNARKGKGNPFYGMKHTDETKRKISENRKGKNTGPRPAFSEEWKRNISKSAKANAQKYKFQHKDGSIFEGTTVDLARHVGSNPAEPWKLVKGQYKTHKGYKLLDIL